MPAPASAPVAGVVSRLGSSAPKIGAYNYVHELFVDFECVVWLSVWGTRPIRNAFNVGEQHEETGERSRSRARERPSRIALAVAVEGLHLWIGAQRARHDY